ncbi:hypothetical protein Goari_020020, partial [Gossypium aridum]|nr:hypothetical protein [Gossypium aridum]
GDQAARRVLHGGLIGEISRFPKTQCCKLGRNGTKAEYGGLNQKRRRNLILKKTEKGRAGRANIPPYVRTSGSSRIWVGSSGCALKRRRLRATESGNTATPFDPHSTPITTERERMRSPGTGTETRARSNGGSHECSGLAREALNTLEVQIDDEDQAMLLLCSLLPSYKSFRETLIYGRDNLSFEDVKSNLLSKDKLDNDFGLNNKSDRQASVLVALRKRD